MAFKSTFVNAFGGGGWVQKDVQRQCRTPLDPLPLTELSGKAMIPSGSKECGQEAFLKRARISAPKVNENCHWKAYNFPNAMTSAQLIDLDWNTISSVNGLYLSGITKRSEIHQASP